MQTIPNPATGGNDLPTAIPGDHNFGLSQDNPHTCWAIDLSPILGKAIQIANSAKQAWIDQELERLDADFEAEQRKGRFWDDATKRKTKTRTKHVLPLFAPHPLDWPPGVAGEVAQYVFHAAIRPVREVAVVATLGLLAGICGRQWQVPKSGLNLYIVLVGRSGIGKEAMHSGISELLKACQQLNPTIGQFADFTEFASGPALTKGCIGRQCFVNVSGELGRRIKRMADSNDSALQTLRTQMTNMYMKSASSSVLGGLGYSATDNNVESLFCVAYSLIGETTPGTFLDALTPEMMEDGFMSRFSVIEYTGDRPPKNRNMLMDPPKQLVSRLADLGTQAQQMCIKDAFMLVRRNAVAGAVLDLFELECDKRTEAAGSNESRRQMWNRAHMKVLRIAALLAVADNHIFPVITQAHADWAINLVLLDIAAFTKRLDSGDVGGDDDSRMAKLAMVLREYLTNPVADSYKVKPEMRENGIVPRSYLHTRSQRHSAFKNHKLGPARALDDTIATMIANGHLMEVQKDKLAETYSYFGHAYRVLNLPDAEAGD
jgi:Protein of unknown function (DUF3987)